MVVIALSSSTCSRFIRYIIVAVLVILSAKFFTFQVKTSSAWSYLGSFGGWQHANFTASNATLGFETILATAPRPEVVPDRLKWRKEGLLAAANRTGLSIQIPIQPIFKQEDIDALPISSKNKDNAHAWLGHLTTLAEAGNYASALILEDDADWDVQIRSVMPNIAEAVHYITGARTFRNSRTSDTPYGTKWDVLWLGHCGENIRFERPLKYFKDPTVPPYYNSWEKNLSPDPHHNRFVHHSSGPICTFAFAVTNEGAKKMLDAPDKGKESFDIWLHVLCKQEKLRCISINPELFHHHEMPGRKDSLINGLSDKEKVAREMTDNIWHSARCNVNHPDDDLVTCMKPQ